MRVIISDKDRAALFSALQVRGVGIERISEMCGVTPRTVSTWRTGRYTIPHEHLSAMIMLARLKHNSLQVTLLPTWWNNRDAARKGALARAVKHGPLGTPEGRRLGGINSYKTRMGRADDIFSPKPIFEPKTNALLAELVGILIGDGCLTKYQVSVAMSSVVDIEYAQFVAGLIKKTFPDQAFPIEEE